ncbi:hypothetical protein QBC38DRAFT_460989 [Podospora fimiseda]|uniref:Uncharacterized protein n=1 Tax=Podospora fimiseda TaxID=252190 RepID=A0AAN7BF89_9PEZI|nr:hypothetical protein QBC38DRAFT_460989 [Podospora fimiseda]
MVDTEAQAGWLVDSLIQQGVFPHENIREWIARASSERVRCGTDAYKFYHSVIVEVNNRYLDILRTAFLVLQADQLEEMLKSAEFFIQFRRDGGLSHYIPMWCCGLVGQNPVSPATLSAAFVRQDIRYGKTVITLGLIDCQDDNDRYTLLDERKTPGFIQDTFTLANYCIKPLASGALDGVGSGHRGGKISCNYHEFGRLADVAGVLFPVDDVWREELSELFDLLQTELPYPKLRPGWWTTTSARYKHSRTGDLTSMHLGATLPSPHPSHGCPK